MYYKNSIAMSYPKYQPRFYPVDPCRHKQPRALTKAYFKSLVHKAVSQAKLNEEREVDKKERQPMLKSLAIFHEAMLVLILVFSFLNIILVLVSGVD